MFPDTETSIGVIFMDSFQIKFFLQYVYFNKNESL